MVCESAYFELSCVPASREHIAHNCTFRCCATRLSYFPLLHHPTIVCLTISNDHGSEHRLLPLESNSRLHLTLKLGTKSTPRLIPAINYNCCWPQKCNGNSVKLRHSREKAYKVEKDKQSEEKINKETRSKQSVVRSQPQLSHSADL